MQPTAIVYTSNTGHTRAYAKLLEKNCEIPAYELSTALKTLSRNTPVLYLGWLMAGTVKDFKKADKYFNVCGVCGVGLCDTGALTDEVRNASGISENIPLFTLQGGLDRKSLRGIYKCMIVLLTKAMACKRNRNESENRMLYLLQTGGNFICERNIYEVLAWFEMS